MCNRDKQATVQMPIRSRTIGSTLNVVSYFYIITTNYLPKSIIGSKCNFCLSLLNYRGQSDYGSLIFFCTQMLNFQGHKDQTAWASSPISSCQSDIFTCIQVGTSHPKLREGNGTPAFSRTPSLDGISIFLDDQFSGLNNSFSLYTCRQWIIQILSMVLPLSVVPKLGWVSESPEESVSGFRFEIPFLESLSW